MTIRAATPADAEELRALIESVEGFASLKALPEDERRACVAQHLAQALSGDDHQVFVATEGDAGRILGYVAVHFLPYLILTGPEGFVSELFVTEDARGQGVGRALLERVTDEARARGCRRLSLLNMTDRESYARGFYQKSGWEERETARNFIRTV